MWADLFRIFYNDNNNTDVSYILSYIGICMLTQKFHMKTMGIVEFKTFKIHLCLYQTITTTKFTFQIYLYFLELEIFQ